MDPFLTIVILRKLHWDSCDCVRYQKILCMSYLLPSPRGDPARARWLLGCSHGAYVDLGNLT